MKKTHFLFVPCVLILLASACNQAEKSSAGSKFLDTSAMDSSVKPGDNFYLYVNGNWIKRTTVPANDVGVGGFYDLYNRTQDSLHVLLDSVSKANDGPGTISQKVGDFYASGMDSATIEKRGYEPLKPYLEKIRNLKNASDVLDYVIAEQKENKSI